MSGIEFPEKLKIIAVKSLLKEEDGIEQFERLLNLESNYYLLNYAFEVIGIRSLDMLNTRLWLTITVSMLNSEFEWWYEEIYEYQMRVLDEYLYKRRVHDLLEIISEDTELSVHARRIININAIKLGRMLLRENLKDPVNHQDFIFLSGGMKDKIIKLTNETLPGYIKRWIDGETPPIKYWDVRGVTSMRDLFSNVVLPAEKNILDLTYWDVSNVTDMSYMFNNVQCKDAPISFIGMNNWNTHKVEDMSYMFQEAYTFNQPLQDWDTSRVTNMRSMFRNATEFDQPLDGWDTGRVENMSHMFSGASSFNQHLDEWITENVKDMNYMFSGATLFNGRMFRYTKNVTDMSGMFYNATYFNKPIEFNSSRVVENMTWMFSGASSFNSSVHFDTGRVENMSWMFHKATSFNHHSIRELDTSRVTDMSGMFQKAISFNQPIGEWDTRRVENMSSMFQEAYIFNQPLQEWDTRRVTTTQSMFQEAYTFNQPIGNWDTGRVTDMSAMFSMTDDFNQPLDKWNTENVKDMSYMFKGAKYFNQPLNNWVTERVTTMQSMFEDAISFVQDINWDAPRLENKDNMFSGSGVMAFAHPVREPSDGYETPDSREDSGEFITPPTSTRDTAPAPAPANSLLNYPTPSHALPFGTGPGYSIFGTLPPRSPPPVPARPPAPIYQPAPVYRHPPSRVTPARPRPVAPLHPSTTNARLDFLTAEHAAGRWPQPPAEDQRQRRQRQIIEARRADQLALARQENRLEHVGPPFGLGGLGN